MPILSQSLRTRYRPIPVERFPLRPFSPVNPRSNTRGRSASGTPQPLSRTVSSMRSSAPPSPSRRPENSTTAPCGRAYFTLFWMSCPKMNSIHLSSVKTVRSRLRRTGDTCAAIMGRAFALMAVVTRSRRLWPRIR